MKNIFKISGVLLLILPLSIQSCKKADNPIKDGAGNVYTSVKIGTQVWLTENLKTTKYNDGAAIPLVSDSAAWGALTTHAYCWYDNDSTANKNTYGALYNWYSVNTNKLCPVGWHIPADVEWDKLINYLGGYYVIAGGKLKETDTSHWKSPNGGANNETGFKALPGGNRNSAGTFSRIRTNGFWWSDLESVNLPSSVWAMYLSYYNGDVYSDYFIKNSGLSVRCVRDY